MLTEFQLDVQTFSPLSMELTEVIGEAVYQKGLKLVDLLECIGYPHAKLHNAGKDAAFALRVSLALAIKTQWAGPRHYSSRFQEFAFARVKATEIFNERLAQEVASQQAKHKATQDRHDVGEYWADMLENQLSWDVV
jgi:hypothetical protein